MNYIPINFDEELPKIYEQQRATIKKVYAKYYVNNSDWSWQILEYSKLQRLFYGLIMPENKLAYFTLEELQRVQIDYGVKILMKNYLFPRKLEVQVA